MVTTPLGFSGQGGTYTLNAVEFLCSVMKLRKTYHNADTTVQDEGWSQLCPVYRDWIVDIEIPWTTTESWDSTQIDEWFDDSDYADAVSATGQNQTFTLPDGTTYDGTGCLDGDYEVTDDAKDAVRLKFSIKGTGELVKNGG